VGIAESQKKLILAYIERKILLSLPSILKNHE